MNKQGPSRLLALLAPYRGRWALATLALLMSSGIGLAVPQGVRIAVDSALSPGGQDLLLSLVLLALGAFLLLACLTFVRSYLMGFLGHRVVAELRVQTFRHLLCHPPGFFQERKSGELISRLTSDIQMLHYAVGAEISIAAKSSLDLVGGLVLIFLMSPTLSLVMLVTVPPLAIGAVWVGRKIRRQSRKLQDQVAGANSRLKEAIVGIETVQAFQAEENEARRYHAGIFGAFRSAMKLTVAKAAFFASAQFGFYTAITLICFFGAQEVHEGQLTAGELVGFMIYTAFIGSALLSLAQIWGNLQSALGASERIFALLDEEPQVRDAEDAKELVDPKGAVTFDAVRFAYPSRSGVEVLKGISLEIGSGETVALVGHSGAGKTTITALLLRFFDPQEGSVSIDGEDLRTLTLESIRGSIATVSQEPMLFSGTIEENIRYGFPEASDAQVEEVIKLSKVDEFSVDLPNGLETLVGERGVKLSGGQRQRIAIARALLADPKILILDEATSHLDTENEALVQQALETLKEGRTTLIIAHRLSTVKSADRILVLSEGNIVEKGTHDSLLELGGLYSRLTRHQFECS